MSKDGEDVLGELYGWDSSIEEVFDLPPDDPQFDEDRALDAYEKIIGIGGEDSQEQPDAVQSLAAQLLTKHFFKFPHLHCNVIEVLVKLCASNRPQPVRIHTIRSMLQIIKAASSGESLEAGPRDRIQACADALLAGEKSNMIVRQLTQLKKALGDPEVPTPKAKDTEDVAVEPTTEPEKVEVREPAVETPKTSKESPRNEVTVTSPPPLPPRKPDSLDKSLPSSRYDDRDFRKRDDRYDGDRRDDRRFNRNNEPYSTQRPLTTSGGNCPPGPYLFIGGIPRETTHADLAEFLEHLDPSVTTSSIQVKIPPRGQAAYAFVSLATTDIAREAIGYVKTTRFLGRNLICDFARGPPCPTLLFVERNGDRTMHEPDAVHFVDFGASPDLWEELCRILDGFGEMEIIREGKVRFREVESAKMVIRKHHLTIFGREIIPVYDIEEQLANDATRRRRNNDMSQGFALKSGRVVGYDDSRHDSRDNRDYRSSRKTMDDDRHYTRNDRYSRTTETDRHVRDHDRDHDHDHKRSRSPPQSSHERIPRGFDRTERTVTSYGRRAEIEGRENTFVPNVKSSLRTDRAERTWFGDHRSTRDDVRTSPDVKHREGRQNQRETQSYRNDQDDRRSTEWSKDRTGDVRRYSRSHDDTSNERPSRSYAVAERTRDHSPIIAEERGPLHDRNDTVRPASSSWVDRGQGRHDDDRYSSEAPFDERKYGGTSERRTELRCTDRRNENQYSNAVDRREENRFGGESEGRSSLRESRSLQRRSSRGDDSRAHQRSPSPLAEVGSGSRSNLDSRRNASFKSVRDERVADMGTYRRSSGSSRRQDDRSIGEIAREQQERLQRRDRDYDRDVDAPADQYAYGESTRSRPSSSYRPQTSPHGSRDASRSHSRHYGDSEVLATTRDRDVDMRSDPMGRGVSLPQVLVRGRSPQRSIERNERYRSAHDDKMGSPTWSGKKRTRSRSLENAHGLLSRDRNDNRGSQYSERHHSSRRDDRREDRRNSMRSSYKNDYVSRDSKRIETSQLATEGDATAAHSPLVSPMISTPKHRDGGDVPSSDKRRGAEDATMESVHSTAETFTEDMDECLVDYEEDGDDA